MHFRSLLQSQTQMKYTPISCNNFASGKLYGTHPPNHIHKALINRVSTGGNSRKVKWEPESL